MGSGEGEVVGGEAVVDEEGVVIGTCRLVGAEAGKRREGCPGMRMIVETVRFQGVGGEVATSFCSQYALSWEGTETRRVHAMDRYYHDAMKISLCDHDGNEHEATAYA